MSLTLKVERKVLSIAGRGARGPMPFGITTAIGDRPGRTLQFAAGGRDVVAVAGATIANAVAATDLAGVTGGALVGTAYEGAPHVARSVSARLADRVHIADFCDDPLILTGQKDGSAALQAAIDWCQNATGRWGGQARPLHLEGSLLKISQPITCHTGTTLIGGNPISQAQGGSAGAIIMEDPANPLPAGSALLTWPDGTNWGRLSGVKINGAGAASVAKGIVYRGGFDLGITGCNIDGWGLEALDMVYGSLHASGGSIEGLLNRAAVDARGYRTGSLRMGATGDSQLYFVEIAGPGGQITNMNAGAAWFAGSSTMRVVGCIFERGEFGLSGIGGGTIYVACRFDTNMGPGVLMDSEGGSGSIFVAPVFTRNSCLVQGAYSHLVATASAGGRNRWVSPVFEDGPPVTGNQVPRVRYNIEDQRDGGGTDFVDEYIDPVFSGSPTLGPILCGNTNGARISFPRGRSGNGDSVNVDALGLDTISLNLTQDRTVVAFTRGVPNQRIAIIDRQAGGFKASIGRSDTITLASGVASLALNGGIVEFLNIGGYDTAARWVQIAPATGAAS